MSDACHLSASATPSTLPSQMVRPARLLQREASQQTLLPPLPELALGRGECQEQLVEAARQSGAVLQRPDAGRVYDCNQQGRFANRSYRVQGRLGVQLQVLCDGPWHGYTPDTSGV